MTLQSTRQKVSEGAEDGGRYFGRSQHHVRPGHRTTRLPSVSGSRGASSVTLWGGAGRDGRGGGWSGRGRTSGALIIGHTSASGWVV